MFALLASHLEWLITGALATALSYSGSASIHACLLIWRGPVFGELDVYALVAILSTSCLIMILLVNWSTTLRELGSRDGHVSSARLIISYWGVLVAVGLIMTLTTFWNTPYPNSTFAKMNSITCHAPEPLLNYRAGQDPSWLWFLVDAEWVQENGCTNPCQQSSF